MSKPSWMNKGVQNREKLPYEVQKKILNAEPLKVDKVQRRRIQTNDPIELNIHLEEFWMLLRRIIKNIIIATAIIFLLPGIKNGYFMLSPFQPLVLQILNALINHIQYSYGNSSEIQIIIGSPLAPINLYLNIGVFLGVLLSLPISIREIYLFIRPGLTEKEFEIIKTILLQATILFSLGSFISYYFILPNTLKILVGAGGLIGDATLLQMYSLSSIVNLMLWGTFGGGLLYASPLILVALVSLDILPAAEIARRRKEILMAIFTLAAIITPDPTIISMIILSLPMVIIVEFMITWAYKIELRKILEEESTSW